MFKRYLSGLALLLAACGGADAEATHAMVTSDASAAAAGGDLTPAPGGRIITIDMVTDEKGNYFHPAEIEAHQGDVLRFVLRSGVHNVNFLADSNPGKPGLPVPGPFLQLPGQTHDVAVSLREGDYYFQCDPHAALGMVGKLEVEDERD
jgi:plastocyanin